MKTAGLRAGLQLGAGVSVLAASGRVSANPLPQAVLPSALLGCLSIDFVGQR